MEKETHTSNSQSMCEKFFNALNVSPTFRSLRRISLRPHNPATDTSIPNPLLPLSSTNTNSNAKHYNLQTQRIGPGNLETKPTTPEKPGPILDSQRADMPEKKKAAEVIAAKIAPVPQPPPQPTIKEKEKMLPQSASTQQKSQVPKVPSKIEPTPPPKPMQEKGKLKIKEETTPLPLQQKEKIEAMEPIPPPTEKVRTGPKAALSNINEKVDDYINRAKIKIRNNSTAGGGKASSIK